MTLWARQSEHNPENIEIKGTSGSVEITVTEHRRDVMRFWSDLGDLLRKAEEAEAETSSHGS